MRPKVNFFIIIGLLVGMINSSAFSITLSSGNGLITSKPGVILTIGSGIRATDSFIDLDPTLSLGDIVVLGDILLGDPPHFDELSGIENVLDNTDPHNVNYFNVTGNLFIDYSAVSSSTAIIDPGPDRFYNFFSNNIFIGVNLDDINDNPYNLFEIVEQPLNLDLTGNFLVYSKSKIESTTITASGNIYIGDFSHLTPVPNPSSIILLSFGLFFLCLARFKKIIRRL
ncbi:MAG: hypothetical protein ABIJ31_10105 [Pseudomonadota bacterium]